MKSLSSHQNKTYLKFWGIYHFIIIGLFLGLCIFKPSAIKIDADLFNMLPKPVDSKAISAADEKLTEITGQNVFILVSNENFDIAKSVAIEVFEKLNGSSRFKSLSLFQDTSSFGDTFNYINKYRYNLLDNKTIELLNSPNGPENFAQNSLAKAYSAFTMTSLETLEDDPFMIGDTCLQYYLETLKDSGTKMSVKDGVLASYTEGRWYIMIRGVLSKEGAALASKTNAIIQIHEVCDPLEKDGTQFTYSGTPFHSYKSSSSASSEITLISTISMIAVLAVLLFIFRRPQPILFSVGSIILSTVVAFCTTIIVFKKMHILTLVFGTSLIGSCIDYSLHYFVSWKGNKDLSSGRDVRKHLMNGLILSLVSTELCYLVLVFAPFNLLKQMAIFTMSGLLSTFLTVIALYPYIPIPEHGRKVALARFIKTPSWYNKKLVGRIVVTCLFVVSIGMLLIFHKNVKVENKVEKLYEKEGRELQDEIIASKVLQYSPSGWFIVSGDSVQDTLQREEQVTAKLKAFNAGKPKGGFVSTSGFVPSVEHQKKSREAVAKLMPLAQAQYDALGYDSSFATKLQKDFEKSAEDFIYYGENVPDFITELVSSAWIGEIDGKYYSVVLPVSVTDYDAYVKIADEVGDVFFVSKLRGMNEDLDKLTKMILKLFIIVYVVLFIILKIFYTWKQTLKITSIPLLIVLVTAAIFAACGISLEFFSITGMILAFGLGLDYVIYMIENERREEDSEYANLESYAIILSFFTTAVSFGALALSSFVPVHLMGLSIFIGLSTGFVSTTFYTRAEF